VEGLISSLREATDKAICVGFGVSGPDQVRRHVCSTPTGPTLVRSSSDRTNEPMRRLGGPRHVAGTSCAVAASRNWTPCTASPLPWTLAD